MPAEYDYKCKECGEITTVSSANKKLVDDGDIVCGHYRHSQLCAGELKRVYTAAPFTIEGKAYLYNGPSWADKGDI